MRSTAAFICSKSVTSARMRSAVASGVFDFQVRQVQFRFAARQQRHTIPSGRKADRQTFTDATSRARDENAGILHSVHLAVPSNPS